MENNLLVTSSPHITDKASTRGIMLKVIIATAPAILASGLIFGYRAWLLIAVTVIACVGFEYLYCVIMKQDVSVGDLSAVVTGILLAFNMPSTFPFWMAVVGAFFAIIIVKAMFGGLGCNFANPAIVGRIILAVSFTQAMTDFAFPKTYSGIDALASATPLAAMRAGQELPLMDLLLGTHGGVLGETCVLALVLGGIYLVATKTISPAIPLTYIGTVFVLSFVSGMNPVAQICSGGLMLGAIFMATDYVTSPFTLKGKLVFGLGLGLITWAIRSYANSAEGVSYAILLMNLFVPYINSLTRQKPLGGAKK